MRRTFMLLLPLILTVVVLSLILLACTDARESTRELEAFTAQACTWDLEFCQGEKKDPLEPVCGREKWIAHCAALRDACAAFKAGDLERGFQLSDASHRWCHPPSLEP